VARVFHLHDISLTKLKTSREVSLSDALGGPFHFDINHEAKALLVKDGATISVAVSFLLSARAAEDKASQKLLLISGEFALEYRRILQAKDVDVTEEDAEVFGKINGVYNAWSYIREVTASCIARFGFPPLTLPPLIIEPEPERTTPAKNGPAEEAK
jgi:hypothetical protein